MLFGYLFMLPNVCQLLGIAHQLICISVTVLYRLGKDLKLLYFVPPMTSN